MPSFKASKPSDQSVGTSQEHITFTTEDSDPSGVYDNTNSKVVTPASVNGGFGYFTGSVKTSANEDMSLFVRRSDNGGSSWFNVALDGLGGGAQGGQVTSGALPLVTGREYRIEYDGTSSATIESDPRTWFGGYLSSSDLGFHCQLSADASITASTLTVPTYNSNTDPYSAISSSVFTVPSEMDGKHMILFHGCQVNSNEDFQTGIQKYNPGTTSWDTVNAHITDDNIGCTCSTGRILVAQGEQYRPFIFADTSNTLKNFPGTFFSGMVVGGVGTP